MIENTILDDKMKHIEIWYFYIRDMVHKGSIKLQYVRIDQQVADALTNTLSRLKFEHLWNNLGVVHKDFPQKGE